MSSEQTVDVLAFADRVLLLTVEDWYDTELAGDYLSAMNEEAQHLASVFRRRVPAG